MNGRYCLITPCRDEATHAEATLRSIWRQTAPPALWIIVDDGSTDGTPRILDEYAAKLPYLRIIHRDNRGFRKVGAGVVDAFYDGYQSINPREFQYICKLDLDLEIPPDYFQRMIQELEHNPRLGTYSGKPYFRGPQGRLISEACGDENSVGMIKFYRRECFEQIGGFVHHVMWDGIDGHRCRMLGWIAESTDDPALRFVHLRPMGASQKSWWTGRVRHGMGQYYMGTGIIYMAISAAYRMTRRPRILGGAGMIWGYARQMIRRSQRYPDPEFQKFLRGYQWRCLLGGKHRATRWINERQRHLWQSTTPATSLLDDASAARVAAPTASKQSLA